MFRNFFFTAIRNLWKHRFVSLINIMGLAIGLACCLVISLYIIHEMSYDHFHPDGERIFRVVKDFVNDDGSKLPDATTPPALAPAMQAEIPEIESVVRIFPSWGFKQLVRYNDKSFYEERICRADSSIFQVFNFPLIKGNPATALEPDKAILITESTARKYFGNENPMGKMIEFVGSETYMVNGVLKDIPENAHFHFDMLLPLKFYNRDNSLLDLHTRWNWYNFYTYAKLKKGARMASVEPKIRSLYKKNRPEENNIYYTQPLYSIHLASNLKWELEPNNDKKYIFIFLTIAILVILIACINYINLSTAKSSVRAKEIAVRKVTGAHKSQLVSQFLTESVIVSLTAGILAILLAQLILPLVNQIAGKNLVLLHSPQLGILLATLGVAILVGIFAGIYPSFYLSSFKPVSIFKGKVKTGKEVFSLRKALVVVQFTISAVMIMGTLIVSRQLQYIQDARLGLDKDHILVLPDLSQLGASQKNILKEQILQLPGVTNASYSDGLIGGQNWTTNFRLKGKENTQLVNYLDVDYDFLDVMGMDIKEGRNFSTAYPADTMNFKSNGQLEQVVGAVILNETAVRDLGIPEPAINREIYWSNDGDTTYYLRLVGVVKDFHFTSLRNQIKPFGFVMDRGRRSTLQIKISNAPVRKTMAAIQDTWKSVIPQRPFQYSFLDETFHNLYRSETTLQNISGWITLLAIFIACMGLFGLVLFMTEQRTKEIGIRKVLGASVMNITTLLSADFLKLVSISVLIAIPIAWLAMHQWLNDFAYRINIEWWVFVVSGISAALIALITIGFHAVKAAISNPIRALRTE